jgi:flagellar motor switch protein FliM
VGQLTYDEYIRDIPNPSYLALLSLHPLTGASIFHIALPVAMAAVDRLLGGTGAGTPPKRALTDIEAALMRDLMARVMRELAYGFESLAALEPKLIRQEFNPQFAQISAATDMVVCMSYDIRIGSQQGEATLCVPFTSLQPVLDEVAGKSLLAGRAPSDPRVLFSAIAARLDAAPVEVTVRFDEVTLSSAEIVDLRPGDVLPLRHATKAPLTVSVAGQRSFSAMAGRRGKRLACLIVDPGTEAKEAQ